MKADEVVAKIMFQFGIETVTADNFNKAVNLVKDYGLESYHSAVKIEKLNEPFYKEMVGDYEAALGPHPRYENGCWIQRTIELREKKERLERIIKQFLSELDKDHTNMVRCTVGDLGVELEDEMREAVTP